MSSLLSFGISGLSTFNGLSLDFFFSVFLGAFISSDSLFALFMRGGGGSTISGACFGWVSFATP